MNIFCSAQTKTVEVFYDLIEQLKNKMTVRKVGFWVAGSQFYNKVVERAPDIEERYIIIKEWECIEEAFSMNKIDYDFLSKYDNIMYNINLYSVVIGDRRLYGGKKVTYAQDYGPRYTYEESLKILEVSLRKIVEAYEKVKPDLSLSFYPAIYGDFLTQIMSEKFKVHHFDLRLARIKNNVMFGNGIFEPSSHIVDHFNRFQQEGPPEELLDKAREFLTQAQNSQIVYEGMVKTTVKK